MIEKHELHVQLRLREEREKKHMSQLNLSLESGVSQNMIAYIEKGKRTPTLRTLLKLCLALKIHPSILFMNDDEEKDNAKKKVMELIQKYM